MKAAAAGGKPRSNTTSSSSLRAGAALKNSNTSNSVNSGSNKSNRPRRTEKEPEAVRKNASEWNAEDQQNVLHYLASLVASTFDSDVSQEDVQRALEAEKVVKRRYEKEDAEHSGNHSEEQRNQSSKQRLNQGSSTPASMSPAVAEEDEEEDIVPLRVSDIVVSSNWRERLKGSRRSNIGSEAFTPAGPRAEGNDDPRDVRLPPPLPSTRASVPLEEDNSGIRDESVALSSSTALADDAGSGSTAVGKVVLSPPKRKWECIKCGAEQEIIDARKVIRSKGSGKLLGNMKTNNLTCASCGYVPQLNPKKKTAMNTCDHEIMECCGLGEVPFHFLVAPPPPHQQEKQYG